MRQTLTNPAFDQGNRLDAAFLGGLRQRRVGLLVEL
jgi:hypothetical protein